MQAEIFQLEQLSRHPGGKKCERHPDGDSDCHRLRCRPRENAPSQAGAVDSVQAGTEKGKKSSNQGGYRFVKECRCGSILSAASLQAWLTYVNGCPTAQAGMANVTGSGSKRLPW